MQSHVLVSFYAVGRPSASTTRARTCLASYRLRRSCSIHSSTRLDSTRPDPLRSQDTPNPGAYPGATGPVQFSADLHKNPVQQTYRFLGDGRRRSLYAHLRDGKVTPGRYLVSDSLSECATPFICVNSRVR